MQDGMTRRRFLGRAAAAGVALASTNTPAADRRPATSGESAQRRWIVDSHVHLRHGDAARTEYPVETIVDVMDKVGIDKSVVFAICTSTKHSIEMAEAAVEKYPDRLIPYVYALPHYARPVIKEIEDVLAAGRFRGIKIHAGECTLAEYVVDPVLEVAGEHGVPCLIDCLGNYAVARRMVEAFPKTRMILAHMGRFLSTDEKLLDRFIGLAEDFDNVLLDLSGVVIVEKIDEAVRRVGSDRLLWGTDGPDKKPDTVAFARNELDKIRNLDLTDQDKANILGQTVCTLLKL